MKRTLLFLISFCILFPNYNLHAQTPDPIISFSFDTDASEGETISDDISSITGELKGAAYCADGDLVLEQPVDTITDHLAMDAESIAINSFSEFSILISFTSDTLDYSGVKNQHIGIWSFGDTYDYNGGLGQDYIYFAPSRQGADKAQAFIACGYGAYCFEHQDTSAIYEPNLMDDTKHEAVVTFDDFEIGLFVDGSPVGTAEVNIDTNNIAALSNAFAYLGKSTYGTNFVSEFKGKIHEFSIYEEALSAEDVAAIYLGVGIKPAEKNLHPKVYSTASSVIIDLHDIERYSASINIFDITGKQIEKLDNSGSREEIFLHSGLYLVQVEYGAHSYTQKVIVYK